MSGIRRKAKSELTIEQDIHRIKTELLKFMFRTLPEILFREHILSTIPFQLGAISPKLLHWDDDSSVIAENSASPWNTI